MRNLHSTWIAFGAAALFYAACAPRVSAAETRFSSPQGKLDVIFRPVDQEHAHRVSAVAGAHRDARTQYQIEFWLKGSSTTVNLFDYADADPAAAPADLFAAMVWSPGEKFVAIPAMVHAREDHHVYQDLASLQGSERVLEFEADHIRWIDASRLAGDLNTKEVPGGIILIDAPGRSAKVILAPLPGIGYKLVSAAGPLLTVKEFANDWIQDKTHWESFTPACLTLNVDTLNKRSVPCP